jgi:tetratricopeptide (TPR) repeat protein
MSLIFQALKQSEQQTTATPSPAARKVVAAPLAGIKPRQGLLSPLGLGVMIAGAGVLVGYLLNQGFAAPAQGAPASQKTVLPSAQAAGLYDPPERQILDIETEGRLPRADLPLPTAAPRLRLSLALPFAAKSAQDPSKSDPGSPPVAKPVTTAPPPASKISAPDSPVAINTRTVEATPVTSTAQPSTEDVRTLFEALNQALESQDKALAQSKLQGIQSKLPESSVARLRAESWFAHQTGDLDSASRIYRRLLEKIPGDELTSVNLASIERKRQRPEQAKEVLAKGLRQNPSSSVLRSAIEQLARSEVKQ